MHFRNLNVGFRNLSVSFRNLNVSFRNLYAVHGVGDKSAIGVKKSEHFGMLGTMNGIKWMSRIKKGNSGNNRGPEPPSTHAGCQDDCSLRNSHEPGLALAL